jgi:Protein of unknown function (DUF1566)/WD domain, G-beta repeat
MYLMRKLAIAMCITFLSLLTSLPALAQTPAPVETPAKLDHVKLMLHPYDVSISAAAFSPDGHYLLTGGPDELVFLWDLAKGQPIRIFEGHDASVTFVAFSADSHSALSCSSDNSTIQWDISTGKQISTTHAPCSQQPTSIKSPNGQFTLNIGTEAHLLDSSTNKPRAALLNLGAGDWAVIDPQGRYDSRTPDHSSVLAWASETQLFDLYQLKRIRKSHFTPMLLAHILKGDKLPDLTGQDAIPFVPTIQIQTPVQPETHQLKLSVPNKSGVNFRLIVMVNQSTIYSGEVPNFSSKAEASTQTVDLSNVIFKPGVNTVKVFVTTSDNQLQGADTIATFNFTPTKEQQENWQQFNDKINQAQSTRGIWIDDQTGLEWTKNDNAADLTWIEAIDYCRNLNLDGHHDWQLPNIDELEAIYDPQSTSEWHVKGNLQLTGWQRSASRESASGLAIGYVFNNKGERFTTPSGFNNRVGNGPVIRALCVRTSDDQ